jgi:hypothetical protein
MDHSYAMLAHRKVGPDLRAGRSYVANPRAEREKSHDWSVSRRAARRSAPTAGYAPAWRPILRPFMCVGPPDFAGNGSNRRDRSSQVCYGNRKYLHYFHANSCAEIQDTVPLHLEFEQKHFFGIFYEGTRLGPIRGIQRRRHAQRPGFSHHSQSFTRQVRDRCVWSEKQVLGRI